MNIDTERLNLPSASAFGITANCPGSVGLIKSLNLPDEKGDEAAERGTRIHKAWETGSLSGLAPDEVEDLNKTIALSTSATEAWLREKTTPGVEGDLQTISERRLWLHDDDLNPILSGQFDKLFIADGHAFVQDLKSGWCRNLTPSEESWQLRVLCVLVWLEYGGKGIGLKTIRASFIKPKFGKNGVDTVEYDINSLLRSTNQIRQVLWEASQPEARFSAGQHCNYCKARQHCRTAASYAMLPSVVAQNAAEMVATLSVADLVKLHQSGPVVRKILDGVNVRLKSLPAETLAEFGLKVGEGRKLDPIVNTEGCFRFLEHQLERSSIFSAMKFTKGDLEKVLINNRDMRKVDAQKWIAENLAVFIEQKKSEGSIEEI
jgi:hypothetical protein